MEILKGSAVRVRGRDYWWKVEDPKKKNGTVLLSRKCKKNKRLVYIYVDRDRITEVKGDGNDS